MTCHVHVHLKSPERDNVVYWKPKRKIINDVDDGPLWGHTMPDRHVIFENFVLVKFIVYIYIYIYVYFHKTQQWFVSYRGPPYNCRWKVLACLFAQVYHEVWRHGNKLKRKTVNWQFTGPHALCIALRPTSYVENNCIIQNDHISDSSNPFSVCSCRRTWLFEAAHFCRPIILQQICCCVKPVVILCVKDATRLHAIHGSVNVLCFCGSHSSVLMLMGVRCQRPCDVWIFRLCLVKQQCVESLLFHLTHIWRVPHPRNGPNLATYKPVYISRRYQLPLTLLFRFKAILTLKTFLYFDHFVLEFIDYQETEDPEAINWIAMFDLKHVEVDRVASLYNVKQKDMWPLMQCSAMVDKFWQQTAGGVALQLPPKSMGTRWSEDLLLLLLIKKQCSLLSLLIKKQCTAAPPQVFAFESETISAPICLNRFTFAESRKSDLWTCVRVLPFPLLPLLFW